MNRIKIASIGILQDFFRTVVFTDKSGNLYMGVEVKYNSNSYICCSVNPDEIRNYINKKTKLTDIYKHNKIYKCENKFIILTELKEPDLSIVRIVDEYDDDLAVHEIWVDIWLDRLQDDREATLSELKKYFD